MSTEPRFGGAFCCLAWSCGRRAVQRGRGADAAHPRRLQFGDAERFVLDADHETDRLRQRRRHAAHRVQARQGGREQHVGTGLLEGLQAADRVVEIGNAANEVLGPRGQRELERARAASTTAATRSTAALKS